MRCDSARPVSLPPVLDIPREHQSTNPPSDAHELEDVVLEDHEGRPVRLGDLWRERPAVLAFVRHYGCVFCRDQAVKLHKLRDDFEAAGVNLVMIGQGTPEMAASFRRAQGVDVGVLVDPDRRIYEMVGAKLGTLGELVGPRQILATLRATVGSHRAGQRRGAPGAASSAMPPSSAASWWWLPTARFATCTCRSTRATTRPPARCSPQRARYGRI